MVWPCGTKFLAEKIDQKIVIFGGHGDKKLHFFTKNGRNVTWMGSNGYIMHITYLNYVDISPAEPKKSIFRVCKTVKMTKIGKMNDFLVKIFFTENRILQLRLALGMTPVRLLWAPWDIYTRIPGRIFKKLIIPVYGMALWYEIFGRKNRPKNRHFSGSRWQKVAFFHEKWSECDLNGLLMGILCT